MTKKEFDQTAPTFSFEDILALELFKFELQVTELEEQAQKEAKIEKKLKQIESSWIKFIFEFEGFNFIMQIILYYIDKKKDFQDTKTFIP